MQIEINPTINMDINTMRIGILGDGILHELVVIDKSSLDGAMVGGGAMRGRAEGVVAIPADKKQLNQKRERDHRRRSLP